MTIRIRASHEDTRPDSGLMASAAAKRLAADIISHWNRGEQPDTQTALKSHPELQKFRSIVLTLAYEEYCCRIEAGETVDPGAYANKFDGYRSEVLRHLDVHSYLMEHCPELRVDSEAWPVSGEEFLGFELQQELGRGAIARVFLAREGSLGDRYVVVKVSHHGEDEAQILGRLKHRNVVPVLSAQFDDATSLTAVCMPYLGCVTLADVILDLFGSGSVPQGAAELQQSVARLSKRTVPAEHDANDHLRLTDSYTTGTLAIVKELASGLAYTHRKGVLHLDLKPSNILVTPACVPMMLDFNLSADSRTKTDRVGGTLPYMSPEQVCRVIDPSANVPEVDARSDIYSLGVVLCETLTGEHPFAGAVDPAFSAGNAATLLRRQQAGIGEQKLVARGIDRRVAELICWCTAFSPQDRPQTAAELNARLARELGYRRRALRFAKAHPATTAIFAALAACVIAVAALFVVTRPTVDQRIWNQGWAAYSDQDYALAARRFQQLADEYSECELVTSGEVWAALGLARQRSEDWKLATRDFQMARSVTGRGRWAAAAGFCATQCQEYAAAAVACESAVEAGFQNAAVFQNWGISLARLSGRENDAARRFSQAIDEDPNLWPAYRSRGMAKFGQSQKAHRPTSPETIADLRKAIDIMERCGQSDAQVYFDLAVVESSAEHASQYVAEVEHNVVRALRAGIDPTLVRETRALVRLLTDKTVQSLIERESNPRRAGRVSSAFDPLAASR
jgi:serine/threonine protein kinase